MTKNYWKKLDTNILLQHPRLTVVEDDVLLPTGTRTKYMRYQGLPDYATVIPIDGQGNIAMIKEYSYPHDEWLYQFPEGSIEEDEAAIACAERELLEEAGLRAKTFEQLAVNYDHHRRNTTRNFVFWAIGADESLKTGGDEEEAGTETHWFTPRQIKAMVGAGDIVQKNALAALAALWSVDHNKTD